MTPAKFVRPYNRILATELTEAREQLRDLNDQFEVCLSDSNFNNDELVKLGFSPSIIMPVAIDFSCLRVNANSQALQFLDDGKTNILFVGRIFPNKRHQDLIKTFYFYKKINPDSRLLFVGSYHPGVRGYSAELQNLIRELDLKRDVIFTGMIPDDDLYTFYNKSHLFLSMSEHEGFFVPLVESMHFNLPVIAYGSTVIPETMGDSGALFYEKDFVMVAELMNEILTRQELYDGIIESQQERVRDFALSHTINIFHTVLENLDINIPEKNYINFQYQNGISA